MRIAITGGSGFLGRALLRRLTTVGGADRIVTFTRDEQKRAQLTAEFGWHPAVRVYAGDVRDAARLPDIFAGCEAVIHAGARKVVTGHPDEADEMVKTNVDGTRHVIEAARSAGVRKLVLISSDKATRPENVYGVTKALAEHLCVSANARTFSHGLRIGAVRYGNVLGSTGSVLVKWREQVAAGQALTMSDPQMSRFWITRDQAVDLVLDTLANLRGGEIVVPNIPAAPLWHLAAALQGVDRFEDLRLAPVSVAPLERGASGQFAPRQGGEKLHEELLSAAEVRRALTVSPSRIVVPPYQHAEMWDSKPWIGSPLAPDTVYRSDVWGWQLTIAQMRELVERA